MRLILSVLAAMALAGPVAAQSPEAEREIVTTVVAEHDRSIALLQRMVEQNSGTLNLEGVRAVGEIVRAELEPLGFEVRWADMAETGRAGHLIATHPGRGRNVLLIGHLDTVFEPSSAFTGFARTTGERGEPLATGPGIIDNKAGMVVLIGALRAMQAAGTLQDANVAVVLTGDEERPGLPLSVARRDLIAAGEAADYALEFESVAADEEGRDYGTIARRGVASWTLTTRGRTGHSAGIFSDGLGFGAIYEMARILDRFRGELREPDLTYNVGVMAGGTPATIDAEGFAVEASGKTNIVAETAVARGDLRALSPEQEARARARMQAIVAENLPQTSAELVFAEDGYPALAPTDGNRALLARLNAVNRDLGLPEMEAFDPGRRGAADSGFVGQFVPTLAGMGASGWGPHAEGETVELDSLIRQSQRAAILIGRLSLGD